MGFIWGLWKRTWELLYDIMGLHRDNEKWKLLFREYEGSRV